MKKSILFLIFFSIYACSSDLFLKQFINNKQCDQILQNNGYFITCYSYKNKGAKYVAYTLFKDKVNSKNIKERPRFYDDLNIPKKYRSTYSDYTRNTFKADRGHLYPDAAADWSQKSLKAVYVMSNIIPQHYSLNRSIHAWRGLEKYGRTLAMKMGNVKVLNGVVYSEHSQKIGRNKISVPNAFWKMYYNKDQNFERCFYFENKPEIKGKKIKDYVVKCKKLI
ncbi:endonuclease [Arcobacter sp. F155]|uniref:DNA/RNA non-specific endonuclease n=1 Tax=Arcobacter sp. F155 TaxID=2044512 RepID=UPI00100C0735|nr:DNA/RNA non-specific endonuclease [Arcobacter sp. F155]RXJ77040.1 endonuclease [Arcobacter sp. F155]